MFSLYKQKQLSATLTILFLFTGIFRANTIPSLSQDITSSTQPHNNCNIYQLIAQENLKSFSSITTSQDGNALHALINDEKEFYEIIEDALKRQLHPCAVEKARLVFSLLDQLTITNATAEHTILDQQSYQDLEILCGSKSSPATYVADALDRTSTYIGKIMFYKKIIQPTANSEKLEQQQNVIKKLLHNTELFNALDKKLKALGETENVVLSFWDKSDLFSALLQDAYLIKLPFQKKNTYIRALTTWLNNNTLPLEINDKLNQFTSLASAAAFSIGTISLSLYGLASLIDNSYAPQLKAFNDKHGLALSAIFTVPGALAYLYSLYNDKSDIKYMIGGINNGFQFLRQPSHLHSHYTFRICLQKKLIALATYLNEIQNISKEISSDPELSTLLPAIDFSHSSSEIKQLLNLLSTNTFTGEASFFSFTGRVLAAYNLMNKHKQELISAMATIGEIDAQVAIARLYKEFEHKRVSFCFPTILHDRSQGPAIFAHEFWNPAIPHASQTAIPNTMKLGWLYGERPSLVVTGPNAGGKSTTMRGLILTILLAQSLGIAPAQELAFTPFDTIITYLNITDDIAAGNSHFMAGVLRARDLVTVVNDLHDDKFALIAVDEVFNGTTFAEGQAAAYALMEYLGSNNNTICITPTHFPLLTELEKNGTSFANKKVTVDYDNDVLSYPRKLQDGISDQVVTFKILQQQNFSDTFLARAQELLEQNK